MKMKTIGVVVPHMPLDKLSEFDLIKAVLTNSKVLGVDFERESLRRELTVYNSREEVIPGPERKFRFRIGINLNEVTYSTSNEEEISWIATYLKNNYQI